jgi:DNA end-binding protein Ku
LPDKKLSPLAGRSFWSGTITFGLISIPVDLYSAMRPRQKSMKMVDKEGHPLGRRYYCPKHDQVLKNDELVRGYETESGKMIVITDEEFASAAPEKSRDIDLQSFVALEEIPPSFFDRPYFLAPGERSGKAYTLLAQTMARTGKAGIGSFVMRSHEYLVAIIADGGILRAEVLRYANELRTPETIGLGKAPAKPKPSLVRDFSKEIDALSEAALDLDELDDLEAQALRKYAERKAKDGKGVIAVGDPEDDDGEAEGGAEVIDLMELLKKSLGGKAAKVAKAPSVGADRSEPRSARKPPAKKGAAKKQVSKTPARKRAAST